MIEYAFREGAVHGPVFDETHVGEWSEEQAGLELHVGAGAEDAGAFEKGVCAWSGAAASTMARKQHHVRTTCFIGFVHSAASE